MGEMREQREQSRTCSNFAESRAKKTEGQMWNLWHGCHKKSERIRGTALAPARNARQKYVNKQNMDVYIKRMQTAKYF